MTDSLRKTVMALGFLAVLWLGVRYLLPLLLPFLLGALLALAAEPAVGYGVRKLHLSRGLSAGLGVTLTLVLLAGVLSLLGALAVRELGSLAGALPDVQYTVEQGMTVLQDWIVNLAGRMPDGARTMVTGTVLELFSGGSSLLNQVTSRIPGMISGVLGWLPKGALGLGTGILSAFMISARLPKLRTWISTRLPASWYEKYLPALRRVRKTLGSWFKAQGKLAAVTYVIVAVGLWLLHTSFPTGLWLIPLGFTPETFYTSDYFPILPYLGFFLLGAVVGRTAYGKKESLLPKVNADHPVLRFFRLCGKHSLWIYLLHQPLLSALFYVILLFQ